MSWQVFVLIGTVLMALVMFFCGKYYHLKIWKRIVMAIVSSFVGVLCTMLMAYIEIGRWDGRSFFGVVFFAPIFMVLFALIIREKPSDILDICGPSEAIMLALMKIKCLIDGCCYGYIMGTGKHGLDIRFPSQIVESITAAIICIVLMWMIYKGKNKGKIYIWYMAIYGFVRFVLNWFRETTPFIWVLPAGNFWALISFSIGLILLLVYRHKEVNSP